MKKVFLLLLILSGSIAANAQYETDSSKTVPPFKIFDNLYYVGTDWASSYLLTTSKGIIIIDALYGKFTKHILASVKQLGFDQKNIAYILCTHGHYDHYEGADTLQKVTHARIGMTDPDWQIAEGKVSNAYESKRSHPKRDLVINDGDSLVLGGTVIHFYMTPGHTPGVLSMDFPVKDGTKQYKAFMFGGVGLNFTGVRQTEMYLHSVDRISNMKNIQVNLSNHPSPGKILERGALLKNRKPGEPHPFVAPEDFQSWLVELKKNAILKLAEEKSK